jgi:hypothetical protein
MFIPDPGPGFSPIPDLGSGSRGQKSTGSRVRIRNIDFLYCVIVATPGDCCYTGRAHYGKYMKNSSVIRIFYNLFYKKFFRDLY